MTRSSKIWLVLGLLFALLNVWGAAYAAIRREGIHTGIHVALTVVTLWLMWRYANRRAATAY